MKPEDVLKEMVTAGQREVRRSTTWRAKAKELDLDSPLQVITVASLVQAEGKTHDDFRKMAEVVYNRLKLDEHRDQRHAGVRLDLSTTSRTRASIDISRVGDHGNYDNPYNTYFHKGLPPGPIGNPGDDALKAALNPTDDGWSTSSRSTARQDRVHQDLRRAPEASRSSTHDAERLRTADDPPGGRARFAHRPLPLPGAAPRRVRGTGPRRTGRTTGSRSTRPRCPGSSAELGPEWAGLSLTMPLKRAVIPLLDEISETAASVEAVNTVVFTEDGRRLGDNTDIPGMVAALRERGIEQVDSRRHPRRRRHRLLRAGRARPDLHRRGRRVRPQRGRAPPRCGSGASGSTSRCARRTGRTRPRPCTPRW